MTCRRACVVLAILCSAACGSGSSPRGAVVGTTTANPHVSTFSLRPVEGTSSPPCRGALVADTDARTCYKLAGAFLGLTDIASAEASYERERQGWSVFVTVADAAKSRFVNAMQQNVGRDVAIVIDGQVVAVPRVNTGIIGKHLEITGNFDEQTAERIASGLTKPRPADPRQRASVCRSSDLQNSFDVPLPTPLYRRLTTAGTYWFGRVHLDPPAKDAHPTSSVSDAWGSLSILHAAGIYEVVLANWTSHADLGLLESNDKPVEYDGVLAWVIIGKHVPVAAVDVSASATVPGVPCYFGTSIAAIDANTGEGIASAYDYSG